jgi:hypothetical protein
LVSGSLVIEMIRQFGVSQLSVAVTEIVTGCMRPFGGQRIDGVADKL